MMIAWDLTQNQIIACRLKIAGHFFDRLRGLIGIRSLTEGDGLLIPKCQGIHTFGMSFPIDIIFLNQEQKVIRLTSTVVPNRFGPVKLESKSVLELPAGTIEKRNIHLGDRFVFI